MWKTSYIVQAVGSFNWYVTGDTLLAIVKGP